MEVIREMGDKPKSKKGPSQEKVYVKQELKKIPLDDEEGLLKYFKGKPYGVQELKEVIKEGSNPNRKE